MTVPLIPICESCARLRPADGLALGLACVAFPDGIPDAVYLNGFDHRNSFDGDGGIRWVLSSEPGARERLAAYELDHPA